MNNFLFLEQDCQIIPSAKERIKPISYIAQNKYCTNDVKIVGIKAPDFIIEELYCFYELPSEDLQTIKKVTACCTHVCSDEYYQNMDYITHTPGSLGGTQTYYMEYYGF